MSMLPIIAISELQKSAKTVLERVTDYAIIQSHGRDRAFILHPSLGRLLLESGMLESLKNMLAAKGAGAPADAKVEDELRGLIGNVLRELSKR